MTDTTPRGNPEIVDGQALPGTAVTEAILRLETGANRYTVADRVTAPPGTCTDGATYLIIATATGAFAGKEEHLATAVGSNAASGWLYRVLGPIDEGAIAYVQDEDTEYKWSGSAWAAVSAVSYTDEQAQDAIGAMVDASLAYDDATPLLKVAQYIASFFFTSAPTSSEVLFLHVAAVAFTIPGNFASALQSYVGTNPTASFALDVQKNGATIGTITVSTGGSVTATTTSGTSKSIAAGDVIKIVAPGSADATAANMAFTLIGAR